MIHRNLSEELNPKQFEIIELACEENLTRAEIAARTGLTCNTVGQYLDKIFRSYKVHSIKELKKAVKNFDQEFQKSVDIINATIANFDLEELNIFFGLDKYRHTHTRGIADTGAEAIKIRKMFNYFYFSSDLQHYPPPVIKSQLLKFIRHARQNANLEFDPANPGFDPGL